MEEQLPTKTDNDGMRDEKGRFLTGNSGGGRPRGSRNRLTDALLATIADDFHQNGLNAVARLRESDPEAYLKLVSSLVPRELILQRERLPDFSELSDEDIAELLIRARRTQSYRKAYEEFTR